MAKIIYQAKSKHKQKRYIVEYVNQYTGNWTESDRFKFLIFAWLDTFVMRSNGSDTRIIDTWED